MLTCSVLYWRHAATGSSLCRSSHELPFVQVNLPHIGCSSAQIHILTEFFVLAIGKHHYLLWRSKRASPVVFSIKMLTYRGLTLPPSEDKEMCALKVISWGLCESEDIAWKRMMWKNYYIGYSSSSALLSSCPSVHSTSGHKQHALC